MQMIKIQLETPQPSSLLFPRRLWFSDLEKANIVDEKFDYQRKLVNWAWGDQVSEQYQYDERGQISNVIIAGYINQTYLRG